MPASLLFLLRVAGPAANFSFFSPFFARAVLGAELDVFSGGAVVMSWARLSSHTSLPFLAGLGASLVIVCVVLLLGTFAAMVRDLLHDFAVWKHPQTPQRRVEEALDARKCPPSATTLQGDPPDLKTYTIPLSEALRGREAMYKGAALPMIESSYSYLSMQEVYKRHDLEDTVVKELGFEDLVQACEQLPKAEAQRVFGEDASGTIFFNPYFFEAQEDVDGMLRALGIARGALPPRSAQEGYKLRLQQWRQRQGSGRGSSKSGLKEALAASTKSEGGGGEAEWFRLVEGDEVFFHNATTGESTWALPSGAVAREWEDDDEDAPPAQELGEEAPPALAAQLPPLRAASATQASPLGADFTRALPSGAVAREWEDDGKRAPPAQELGEEASPAQAAPLPPLRAATAAQASPLGAPETPPSGGVALLPPLLHLSEASLAVSTRHSPAHPQRVPSLLFSQQPASLSTPYTFENPLFQALAGGALPPPLQRKK